MHTRGGRRTPTTTTAPDAAAATTTTTTAMPNGTTAAVRRRRGSGASKTRSNATQRRRNGGLKSIKEQEDTPQSSLRSNGNYMANTDDDDDNDDDDSEDNNSSSSSSATSSSSSSASDNSNSSAEGQPPKTNQPQQPQSSTATTTAKKSTASNSSTAKRRLPPVASSSGHFPGEQTPTKRARHNSQTIASSPIDVQVELKLYGTIKSVLATQYFNVVERLQLDFQPNCMSNLEHCAQFHSRNGDPPNEIDDYLVRDARNFISEDRPHVFLKFVAKMSVNNEFPGMTLVLCLLELILTVNRPSHNHYTAPFILESANLLFENVTNNFPPCWLDVRDSYKKLLVEKLHIDLPKNKYEVSGGILKVVLTMLETVLQDEADGDLMEEKNASAESDDFFAWEQKNKQQYLFEMLPRDDKLDRIFLVMHLLVKLMEGDLAIWIIRHPKNTSSTMSKPKKMPLIGYFLWPAEECGQINALVKRILNLFVVCISIGIADDKVKILARFVNLVSHAINLCELQPKPGEIKYPNIQSHTEIFALEVKKTIEKIQTCNVDLFLAVIDHLRAPFIQIIAIDQLLMKFNRDVGKPSMKKLYANFTKRRWRECDEEGSRKIFTHQPDAFGLNRYPVYRPLTQKKRTSDIYQTDYLHLLLSSYRSYQLLYQVDVITALNEEPTATANGAAPAAAAAARTAADPEDSKSLESGMTATEYEAHTRSVNKQRQDKFNFSEMEKGIKRLERIAEQSAAVDMAYYPRIDCTLKEICVDASIVLRYREDIKYSCMLRELIEEFAADYGPIFDPWLQGVRRRPALRMFTAFGTATSGAPAAEEHASSSAASSQDDD